MASGPTSAALPDGECAPSNFVERIGAALIAPRLAIRHASERVGTDAALLLLMAFAVVHTREAVASGWLLAVDGFASGGMALATALSRAISVKLAFLFGAGLVIWLGSGRGRSFSRGFDHAAVALVPVVFVEVVATTLSRAFYEVPPPWIQTVATVAAMGWGTLVAIGAVIESRRDPGGRPVSVRSRLRRASAVFALAAAVLLAVQVSWVVRHADRLRPMSSGDVAPEVNLPIIDGAGKLGPGRISLAGLRGKVVLLDFWATWCGPCRDSMPHLQALHQRFGSDGFVLVSINTDDPTKARSFATTHSLTFPMVYDTEGAGAAYRVKSIPHLVLVDQLGVVRRVYRGGLSASDLGHDIERLIGR